MKQRLLMTIVALHCFIAVFAGSLAVDNVTMKPGETKAMTISVASSTSGCYGVQFDMKLPEGFLLEKGSNGNVYEVSSDISCSTLDKGNGLYRFILYSSSLQELKGGTLISVNLKSSSSQTLGNYDVTLSNIVISDYEGKETNENGITIGVNVSDSFTLIYKVDGEVYKTFNYEFGASITPEAEPIKEGYTFSGWSWIPKKMPAEDVIITGSFTKGNYKLTYMVDGDVYKTVRYDYGVSINPEEVPTKEGYTFTGWSYIPKSMPAEDVIVTGSFTVNKYKLIYKVDGREYKVSEVEYGASLKKEAEPTKEGYSFSGWSWIPKVMPAEDVIITGTFELEPVTIKAEDKMRVYGETNPVWTYVTTVGTIYGSGEPAISCTATSKSSVGTYDITIEKGTVENPVTLINGTLTINKAPLKVTAKNYTINQGDALPEFELTYAGFKNGETESVLTKQPKVTCSVASSNKPGIYDILVSDATADNYEISYVAGRLGIRDLFALKGDINRDGEIDVTDVVELIDMVLGGIYDPAGDINGDGEVDVTDVVELIDMVLAGE